jgi:hypothetical protein
LKEFWDSVDYGYYIINKDNQLVLKEISDITSHEAKILGYDVNLFPIDFIKRKLLEQIIFNGFNSNEFFTLCLLHFDVFRWIDKNLAIPFSEFNSVSRS